jgi:hypothetical protein
MLECYAPSGRRHGSAEKIMKSFVLAISAGLFFFCTPFHAEEIQLKDGNRVSGKIIAVTDASFQIKTTYGNIQVPRTDILSITFPENQPKPKPGDAAGAGPRAIDESLVGTEYANHTADFQLTVPKGWIISDDVRNQNKDIVAALVSEDTTLILMVTPEKFSGPYATYRLLAETQYKSIFGDYEKLSENDIQLDGRPGTRIVWHGKNTKANNAQLKSVVYFVPYDGRIVRLSFLTLEPLFDDALPIFEKIATSYHTITP